jgi:hypothetical protein
VDKWISERVRGEWYKVRLGTFIYFLSVSVFKFCSLKAVGSVGDGCDVMPVLVPASA